MSITFPPGPHTLSADFAATADGDDDVNVGDTVTYTYEYTPTNPLSFNSDWTISLTLPSGPAQIAASINPFTGGVVGSTTYNVAAGDAGSVITASVDTVEVTNTDNGLFVSCTPTGNNTISLYVNEPPAPADDNGTTQQDVPGTFDVLANDGASVDSGASTGVAQDGTGQDDTANTGPVTIVGAASNGTCTPSGNQIEYTPNAGFSGSDSCVYQVVDNDGATGQATLNITVEAAAPTLSIDLVKTVGTDPSTCATDSTISVPAGTTVYYCYTVTNTGDATISTHDLVDDQLGTLLSDFQFDLGPGTNINTVAAGLTVDAVINSETTNTATWTGSVGEVSTSAEATATVSVDPTEPTTTTIAPVETTTTVAAPPTTDGSTGPATTVGGATTTTPGGTLPATGGGGSDIPAYAIVIACAGGVLVLLSKRARAAAA